MGTLLEFMNSRTNRARVLVLILPAIFAMSGCERAKETPVDSDRIAFAPDEHQKDFGKYRLHVNALTTDQLPQEVAKEYKIARSTGRAMLNVVITEKSDGKEQPVTGTVVASARNLAGQIKELNMRELVEQDAIYYIGDTAVDDKETLIFDIDVVPSSEAEGWKVTYRHEFFH